MNFKLFFVVICVLVKGIQGHAAIMTSPIGISIAYINDKDFAQFPVPNGSVYGVRIGALMAKNRDVYGLDINGFVGYSNNSAGVQIAAYGNEIVNHARVFGLQLAGIRNKVGAAEIYGLQLAGVYNHILGEGEVYGAEVAIAGNYSPKTEVNGFQIGAFNRAKEVRGFQIGIVNVADKVHGVQIGLININHGGLLPVFPVINMGF